MHTSDSSTPCREPRDDDLERLYGAVLSDLEGLLDPKYRWTDGEAFWIDDMIVQLRVWGIELDIKSGTLRWLQHDYLREAAATRVNLQAVRSSLTRLISHMSRELDMEMRAETETDGTANTELEYSHLTLMDDFTRCVEGLCDLSESLQIVISLHTKQGPAARVKEFMNARKLASIGAQLPTVKTAQETEIRLVGNYAEPLAKSWDMPTLEGSLVGESREDEDAKSVGSPEETAVSTRDQTVPKYPLISVVMNNTPGPMAHLASFGGSTAIKAPYVCRQMFHGSFFDYPERRGWDKDKLYLGDFEGRTLEETRGFLQEWMYFGPLFHILDSPGMSFNPQDFIYLTEDGEEWITTERLPEYMKRWYFQPKSGYQGGRTLKQRKETHRHVYSCLKQIHRYVLRYCGKDSNSEKYYPPTTFWPLTPELSLSIIVLADSLTKAGFEATGISFDLNWGVSGLLVERMIASGWCPNVIRTLTTAQQVHLHYSAETLGAPYPQKYHTGCNEFLCQVDQIDERTYQTAHTTEGCQCDFMGPPIDMIAAILESGGIPLVECHEEDSRFVLRVVRQTVTLSRNYIAISHVWSDGLGNPAQNSLPTCQLRRLQQLVNNLITEAPTLTSLAWWCDTLCVPVETVWRKTAIRKMRDTYANATQVLVLDRGLTTVSSSTTTLEIYLRIKLSNWMRRLWTLQEGIVGKSIVVQLLDGTKKLSDIDRAMFQEEQNLRRFIYTRYSFDSYSVLGTFLRQGDKPQHLKLESYSKLLEWRSTSKQADETVCLMSMLDMTKYLGELLELEDNDYEGRMIHLLKNLTTIPITVLFRPPPRLSTIGFRWAPTSFLSCFREIETAPFRPLRGFGHIGPNGSGLQVKCAGLQLLESGDSLPQIGQVFLLQPQGDNADLHYVSYPGAVADKNTDWTAKAVDGRSDLRRPAIIICQQLSSLGIIDGALVDIYGEPEAELISCYYIAWVGIVNAAESIYVSNSIKFVNAKIIKKEQEWLVM